MALIVVSGAKIVNEGIIKELDLCLKDGVIHELGQNLTSKYSTATVYDYSGCYLFPGVIDDQVHFREPGLTHKADISTESAAALAGGVTSFMEMPNTSPPALTQELLNQKYELARGRSFSNYSFYMGCSNENLDEVLRTPLDSVCGVKIFMGSSTGNMLVDSEKALEGLFSQVPHLITTHCESEEVINKDKEELLAQYSEEDISASMHPVFRSRNACLVSSSKAVALAQKHGTRLHILHISTEDEIKLFSNLPLKDKRITSEVCIHHMWYAEEDYQTLGNLIKCNPAIKTSKDRKALREALKNNVFDVVATDHAPHTWEEKQAHYLKAPSGLPLIQHTLLVMLQIAKQEGWSLPFVAEKMSHAPAELFQVKDRGYIREGYWGDFAIVKPIPFQVKKEDLYYKCGWSPLEGQSFDHQVVATFLNGELAFQNGKLIGGAKGQRLQFNR